MEDPELSTTKNRIYFSIFLAITGGMIIIWFLLRGFFVDEFIDPFGTVNIDKSAKVGDFIGGFVGAIFTLVGIVLLYETLHLQRKEFIESRKVFERQQFETKFFSLIKMYQDIIASMHYDVAESAEKYIGKEFFLKHKKDIYRDYVYTNSFFKNRKSAIDSYTRFYISNKENVAHYFRTIYRIFKLIADTKYDDREKMSYAKIVRAQLSEPELFFLNYNACTIYGKNFRDLIITFNLIKHLPILERLEFKFWKEKISNEKVNSVNILFEELLDFIKSKKDKFYKTYLRGRFAISIHKVDNKLSIIMIRNNNQTYNDNIQEGYGLDDFSNSDIEKLLKCWALEIISHRNYGLLNDILNVSTKVDIETLQEHKYKFTCIIESKNNTNLKIK
ncbi:MAG: putative phage abortive infection protein [Flavobacterium sp.]